MSTEKECEDCCNTFQEKECEDCCNTFQENEGRPYKYEPEIWLCDDCHDERMKDEEVI